MMDLTVSEEQRSIIETGRAVASDCYPRGEMLAASQDLRLMVVDDGRWQRMADAGFFGILAPSAVGGMDARLTDAVLLHAALGGVPVGLSVLATALAAGFAADAGNQSLAQDLVTGRIRAGFATGGLGLDVGVGDLLVSVDESSARLARLISAAQEVCFDATTRLVRPVQTDEVQVLEGRAPLQTARALLAAHLVGLAEAATAESVAYGKIREQFGKPIGSFQAVKHRCAEMATRAYTARAQMCVAAVMLQASAGAVGRLEVDSAYLLAMRAATANADDNIQNHGGVGMTAGNVHGVLMKRAQLSSRVVGTERDLIDGLLETPRGELTCDA
jgi:alkylation response protein AidB-like acyl-CoA dehydrogenase